MTTTNYNSQRPASVIDAPIPDRVSIEPSSSHYFPKHKMLGVRFRGEEIHNCVEFCVSGNWVRRSVGNNAKGRIKLERGSPVALLFRGTVEPFWRKR